jgi:hypothetical protein
VETYDVEEDTDRGAFAELGAMTSLATVDFHVFSALSALPTLSSLGNAPASLRSLSITLETAISDSPLTTRVRAAVSSAWLAAPWGGRLQYLSVVVPIDELPFNVHFIAALASLETLCLPRGLTDQMLCALGFAAVNLQHVEVGGDLISDDGLATFVVSAPSLKTLRVTSARGVSLGLAAECSRRLQHRPPDGIEGDDSTSSLVQSATLTHLGFIKCGECTNVLDVVSLAVLDTVWPKLCELNIVDDCGQLSDEVIAWLSDDSSRTFRFTLRDAGKLSVM